MTTDRIEKNLIRATYRITTPMFCGGAEQQAEFRLPSFKGVLRFWWRAYSRRVLTLRFVSSIESDKQTTDIKQREVICV